MQQQKILQSNKFYLPIFDKKISGEKNCDKIANLAGALCQTLPGYPDVQGGVDLLPPPLGVREVDHLLKGRHQSISPERFSYVFS